MAGRVQLYETLRDQGPLEAREVQEALYGGGDGAVNWRRDHVAGLAEDELLLEAPAERFGQEHRFDGRRRGSKKLFGFGSGLGLVLAVAASTRRIRVGLLDANLCLVGELVETTTDDFAQGQVRAESLDQYVKTISTQINKCLSGSPREHLDAIRAVGVALPLAVEPDTGLVSDEERHDYAFCRALLRAWPRGLRFRPKPEQIAWSTDVTAAGHGYAVLHKDQGFHHAGSVLVVKVSGRFRHGIFLNGRPLLSASGRGRAIGGLRVVASEVHSEFDVSSGLLDDYASLVGLRRYVLPA